MRSNIPKLIRATVYLSLHLHYSKRYTFLHRALCEPFRIPAAPRLNSFTRVIKRTSPTRLPPPLLSVVVVIRTAGAFSVSSGTRLC